MTDCGSCKVTQVQLLLVELMINVTVEGEVVQLVVVELVKMKVVGAVVGLTVIEIEIGVSLLAMLGLEFASVDCSDDRCRPFLYEL